LLTFECDVFYRINISLHESLLLNHGAGCPLQIGSLTRFGGYIDHLSKTPASKNSAVLDPPEKGYEALLP